MTFGKNGIHYNILFIFSGVATGGQGGRVSLTAKNMPKVWKRGKKEGERGENREKEKNLEEEAKIEKVLSLYPS